MKTSTSTETTFPSDPPTEERLARLTGFNPSSTESVNASNFNTPSSTRSPLLPPEDLEEQITRHSFASSPLSKLVFVTGAVFLVVFIASLFLSQFQSPCESISAKKVDDIQPNPQSPLLSSETKDPEKEELLSELALREQQEGLKNLDSQKAQKRRLQTGQSIRKTWGKNDWGSFNSYSASYSPHSTNLSSPSHSLFTSRLFTTAPSPISCSPKAKHLAPSDSDRSHPTMDTTGSSWFFRGRIS